MFREKTRLVQRRGFLQRIKPFYFLLIYLAAIPTYAISYCIFVPHGFFAPNAYLENSAKMDTQSIENIIKSAILANLPGTKPQSASKMDRTFTKSDYIDVKQLSIDKGGHLNFQLYASDNPRNMDRIHVVLLNDAAKAEVAKGVYAISMFIYIGDPLYDDLRDPSSAEDYKLLNSLFPQPPQYENVWGGGFLSVASRQVAG